MKHETNNYFRSVKGLVSASLVCWCLLVSSSCAGEGARPFAVLETDSQVSYRYLNNGCEVALQIRVIDGIRDGIVGLRRVCGDDYKKELATLRLLLSAMKDSGASLNGSRSVFVGRVTQPAIREAVREHFTVQGICITKSGGLAESEVLKEVVEGRLFSALQEEFSQAGYVVRPSSLENLEWSDVRGSRAVPCAQGGGLLSRVPTGFMIWFSVSDVQNHND